MQMNILEEQQEFKKESMNIINDINRKQDTMASNIDKHNETILTQMAAYNENYNLKLDDIKEFTDFFGKLNGNNYHPNEISADLISHMLLGKKTDSLAFNKLTQWWNKL